MTYRAAPVTQRDGSELQNSNCLMAAAAVGIDYHTLGDITSTGKKMRGYSGDTSGGTNTDEIERAWKTGYDQDPTTRDGRPWSDVLADLEAGRLVMLQVWHATVGGPCLSGSGAYGHGLAVAPERDGSKWLVADPWCKPPKWAWVAESKLKAGAEEWVRHSASGASSGGYGVEWPEPWALPWPAIVAAARVLMDRYRPGHPSPFVHPPEGVGGSPGVLFASTKPHGGSDMAINTNGSHLASDRRVDLTADAGFYAEPEFVTKYGTLDAGRHCVLLGPALGSNAFAILVNTSKPYDDGQDRDTVVYVTKDKCSDPYTVEPPPPDPDPDCDVRVLDAIDARDQEWNDWLDAAPPPLGGARGNAEALIAWLDDTPDAQDAEG